jgi:hypothetical protein
MLQRITDIVNSVVVEAGGEPLTGDDVIALIGEQSAAATQDSSGRQGAPMHSAEHAPGGVVVLSPVPANNPWVVTLLTVP